MWMASRGARELHDEYRCEGDPHVHVVWAGKRLLAGDPCFHDSAITGTEWYTELMQVVPIGDSASFVFAVASNRMSRCRSFSSSE
jgi:hypothetical protein